MRLVSGPGDLSPDGASLALRCLLLKWGRKASQCCGKPTYSAFLLDFSLNNAIYYDAYRLQVSAVGVVAVLITILLSGLIDLRIII